MSYLKHLKPSARRGLVIACIAVVCSGLVGYMAFWMMHDIVVEEMTQEHLQLVHMIGMNVEALGGLEKLPEVWAEIGPKQAGEYLCVVNQVGDVAFHSERPHVVGKNVGHVMIANSLDEQPKTLSALIEAGVDYAGMHVNSQGERQIVAFGFRPKLNALIAIHVPAELVVDKTWQAALPWGVGFAVLTFILWPFALKGVCRAYQLSEAEIVEKNQQLQAQADLQHNLQTQLFQSQKMEAVGQLAGGLAHDFNNLLTGILGCAHFLKKNMASNDPRLEDVEEIKRTAEQGAVLIRQLLAFSRKQVVYPCHVDLNETLLRMKKMFKRVLGEQIEIKVTGEKSLPAVWVDPNLVEIVILNLAINARDAMPQGGVLTFDLGLGDGERNAAQFDDSVLEGDYVLMRITDTGIGMDADTIEQIFEPFFTTKQKGQGTGLGLATVHGIVKQNNGHIYVNSTLGEGTTFGVYLPVAKREGSEGNMVENSETKLVIEGEPNGISAKVLLVEDEPSVRRLGVRLLTLMGYTVLEASHGKEALALYADQLLDVNLVITDVIMPEMSGTELASHLRERGVEVPVIYLSGYWEDEIPQENALPAHALYLHKPFDADELLEMMQKALGAPTRS